jgi:ABC-type branched-subunit amino acid transport system substrate-binding protein
MDRRVLSLMFSATLCLICDLCFADLPDCRIGFIAGLSGPGSVYGIAPRNGLQLAAAEITGGKLDLIIEDDQFSPKHTVAAFKKLVARDKAQIIFVVGSSMALAVAPLAERQALPLVALASDSRISSGRKHVIRAYSSGEDEGGFIWAEVQRRKYQRIAFVFTTADYNRAVADGFKAAAEGAAVTYFEEVLPTEMDFRAHVARIAKHKVDAVGLCLAPGQISTFARQLKSLTNSTQVFSCLTLDSKAEVQAAGGALGGAWYVTSDVSPKFRLKYREMFGNEDFVGGAAIMYELGAQLGSFCAADRSKYQFPENLLQLFQTHISGGRATQLTAVSANGERYLRPPLVVRMVE